MNERRTYKVADHLFSIEMPQDSFLWDRMKMSYGPFEVVSQENEDCIFSLLVCDETVAEGASLVYSNKEDVEEGFISIEVFRTPDGHYFELTQPGSTQINSKLLISDDFRTAKVSIAGRQIEQWLIFNTSVDFCFLLATSGRGTVLTHASSVIYEGRAYLFLGKSGTGKSTHSRMWQTALDNVVLMNDDHPVLRVGEDGTTTAYGSPWSGKTPCYRNASSPLKGIVRLSQAPLNRISKSAALHAYASLMPSCSCLRWDSEATRMLHETVETVISKVGVWSLECLPDKDAARVCREACNGKI